MKTLELLFKNAAGRTVRFSVPYPQEPVDPAAVSSVMDLFIAKNIFDSTGGDLVAKAGAQLVERNVTDITLP
ncbi:hypothetical protein BSNK01_17800 [Bacillaceae bacterium]